MIIFIITLLILFTIGFLYWIYQIAKEEIDPEDFIEEEFESFTFHFKFNRRGEARTIKIECKKNDLSRYIVYSENGFVDFNLEQYIIDEDPELFKQLKIWEKTGAYCFGGVEYVD